MLIVVIATISITIIYIIIICSSSSSSSSSRSTGGCFSSDIDIGVCETNTPFVLALAAQASSRNCSPGPDLAL